MSWLISTAMMKLYESSRSLPVPAAEFLVDNCLDGKQCAPLNGNPTPLAYCAPDKMKDFSHLSRFGATFKVLTVDSGAELLTWYLAASHVRTLAALEKEKELMAINQVCGNIWRELSVKYDRDTRSWKTHQCLFPEDLPESLVTLPKWGMTRSGAVLERTTPFGLMEIRARIMNAKEYGSLQRFPTPRSNDAQKRGNFDITNHRNGLPAAVKRFPTPRASDSKGSGQAVKRKDGRSRMDQLAYATERNTDGTPVGGQLNPMWVEWLMGWPIGWTDLKPSETARCHYAPPRRGESLQQRRVAQGMGGRERSPRSGR